MTTAFDPSDPINEVGITATMAGYWFSNWWSVRPAATINAFNSSNLDGTYGITANSNFGNPLGWLNVCNNPGNATQKFLAYDNNAAGATYTLPAAGAGIWPNARDNSGTSAARGYMNCSSWMNSYPASTGSPYASVPMTDDGSRFVASTAALADSPFIFFCMAWQYTGGIKLGTSTKFWVNNTYTTGNMPYSSSQYSLSIGSTLNGTFEFAPWSQTNGAHVALACPTTFGAEQNSLVYMIDGHVLSLSNEQGMWNGDNYAVPAGTAINSIRLYSSVISELIVAGGTLTRVQQHKLALRLAYSYGTPHPALTSTGARNPGLNVICLGNSTTGTGYPGSVDWELFNAGTSGLASNYGIYSGSDDQILSQTEGVIEELNFWRDYGRTPIVIQHSGHNTNFTPGWSEAAVTSSQHAIQRIRGAGHRVILWSPSTWNQDTGRETNRLSLLQWMTGTGCPAPATTDTTFAADRSVAYTPDYTNISAYVDGFVDIGNSHQWGIWDNGPASGSGTSGSPYLYPAGTSRGDFYSTGSGATSGPALTGLWADQVHPAAYGDQSYAKLTLPCLTQGLAIATASAITGTSCTLTITGSVAGTTFQWYQGGSVKNSILLTGTGAAITVTGLTAGATYFFVCRATGTMPGQWSGIPRYWWLETPVTVTTSSGGTTISGLATSRAFGGY